MAGDAPQLKDEFSTRDLFGFNFNFREFCAHFIFYGEVQISAAVKKR